MVSSELITECIAGNEASIQMLVRTYQRGVFQVALSILDCADATQSEAAGQAEVATRETFVAALDRMGSYRPDTQFETWLYGVAVGISRRRAVQWRRERRLRGLLSHAARILLPWRKPALEAAGKPAPEGEASAAVLERTRRDEMLWKAVCLLKEPMRLPVILRYYHDFSIEQIARMLNTSEGAIHARLDMAREKIAARAEIATKVG